MGVKVAKFGGSSLASAEQFQKVKGIIFADPQRRYVVPSAPGKRNYTDVKVTDMLYECQKKASLGENIDDLFSNIIERYMDIAFELSLKIDLLPYLEEVKENIENGANAAYAASRGEYLNGLLLADYLEFDFIDAADVIFFNDKGLLDSEKTQKALEKCFEKHKKAVVPGFYGALADGTIMTFSRGGSDISGAIVAAGCYADIYENWTDVSGMLVADPRMVKDPKPIRIITYTELRELAYMGASVLHDEAIFPVRQACIPINVRNTNRPNEAGTMIVPEGTEILDQSPITGIAGRKGFVILAMEKDKMNSEIGFAADALGVLRDFNVSIEHLPTGIDTMSLVIEDVQLQGKRQEVVNTLMNTCQPDTLEIYENMALLAVVGHGMVQRVGTSATIFSALAQEQINIRMIDQGSSELNIIIGIENDELDHAMNAIYRAFEDQIVS